MELQRVPTLLATLLIATLLQAPGAAADTNPVLPDLGEIRYFDVPLLAGVGDDSVVNGVPIPGVGLPDPNLVCDTEDFITADGPATSATCGFKDVETDDSRVRCVQVEVELYAYGYGDAGVGARCNGGPSASCMVYVRNSQAYCEAAAGSGGTSPFYCWVWVRGEVGGEAVCRFYYYTYSADAETD